MPLEERENFVRSKYKEILEEYLQKELIKGYIATETCLRVEMYLEITEKLDIEELRSRFNAKSTLECRGKEAIKYLFEVICGLDSVIKGEDQVLAQIKKSYLAHLENKKTSSFLNIIFNSAIEVGKKFRAESKITEKNLSLDSISVKFIKNKFGELDGKRIFVIGVGDLSQSILAILHKYDNCNLIMTNRSNRKSIELKKVFNNVETAEFKEKYDVVEKSDIVISATSAPHLILEKDKMGKILSDGKKRFFLDLAVPRDIETSIGEASNTMLYHLDDIWEEYNKNVKKRDKVVDEFYYIIDEQYKETIEKLLKREKYLKK
jgi:glutamyl-tRNA reductase